MPDTFGITIFSLFVLRLVERVTPSISFKSLSIKAEAGVDEDALKAVLRKYHASIYRTDYEIDNVEGKKTLYYTLGIRRRPARDKYPTGALMQELAGVDNVRKVSLHA